MNNKFGMKGYVVIRLFDADRNLKSYQKVENLITTAGDEYYAKRSAAGVLPAANADVTKVTGMKLGTGTTLPSKSGAGAALVVYKTGSNTAFTATYPTVEAVGGDTGWKVTYYGIWAPGTATSTTLSEAVIVNDSAADATSVAANTISRVTFTPINKTAADTLEISWSHTFLGA